ncbi:MAG: dihydroorotase family protein [Candidatus Thorarchaeota archaeon]
MLLKNASIWYHEQILHGHIFVNEETGLINRVSLSDSSRKPYEESIDLKGKLVIPSFVDIHSHLRDFEESHKETYETGALAAAAGGFTTIFDMPNKINPINSSKHLKKVVEKASRIKSCEIIPYVLLNKDTESSLISNYPYSKAYLGATTGNYITDVSGVKAFLTKLSGVIVVHCEDNERINNNLKRFPATLENHGKIHDSLTEVLAINNLLKATKDIIIKGKLHIAHVTLRKSIEILHSRGISFEVTPHHLFLNNDDLAYLGVKGKMNPPLRSKLEQQNLLKAFLTNQIPIISTDHAPHTKQEKIDLELAGVPGLETCFPLLFDFCKPLDLKKLKLIIQVLAINPRVLMNLSGRGIIDANEPANLTVIDRKKKRKIRGEDLFTKCKWSPWEGHELQGWPVLTIRKGKITYNDL